MSVTALFTGIAGLAATFAPQELLALAGVPARGVLPLFVQVMGALYCAFAALNWMSRHSTIGGIYNRPLALANLLHFFVAAMALVKAALAGAPPGVTAIAVPYAILALAFGYLVFFWSPVKSAV